MDRPRVKTITIHDFKGFRSKDVQPIDLKGKNLLLYGENGSGKTTLFTALKEMLSPTSTRGFDNDFSKASCLKNRLSGVKDLNGKVSLEFEYKKAKGDKEIPPMEWRINEERPSSHSYFQPMSLSSGFLDYRAILLTHFLDYENEQINLFKLVVETLLRDIQTTQDVPAAFGAEWKSIQEQQQKVAAALDTDRKKIDIAHPDYSTTISALGFVVSDYPDEDWEGDEGEEPPEPNVQAAFQRFTDDRCDRLADRVEDFVGSLKTQLGEVEGLANQYLKTFDPWLELVFDLDHVQIPTDRDALKRVHWNRLACLPLQARFRGTLFEHPGTIFNEARLTALALTIYLAALKLQGEAQARSDDETIAPRLLVLDDVLIGLDMVHRLPILETLETQFIADGWQVILLTFDRTWYDVAKQRIEVNRRIAKGQKLAEKWQCSQIFAVRAGNFEKTVFEMDTGHLARARNCFAACDFNAAAVHLRIAFESVLKMGCTKFRLPIRYQENAKPQTGDFWEALVSYSNGAEPQIVGPDLERTIRESLKWVMNPLSHSESINSFNSEIDRAIRAVEELESSIINAPKPNDRSQPEVNST